MFHIYHKIWSKSTQIVQKMYFYGLTKVEKVLKLRHILIFNKLLFTFKTFSIMANKSQNARKNVKKTKGTVTKAPSAYQQDKAKEAAKSKRAKKQARKAAQGKVDK